MIAKLLVDLSNTMHFHGDMVLARIILGFLAIAPMTGYDLMRAFRSSANHFWSADKAQVYRTLSALVDEGRARTERVAGTNAPDRIVHHITDDGRAALREWLTSGPDRHAERDAFLARVFFSDTIETAPLRDVIETRRREALDELDALERTRETTAHPDPSTERGAWLRSMTLDHGIRATLTHIDWLDDILTSLPDDQEQ